LYSYVENMGSAHEVTDESNDRLEREIEEVRRLRETLKRELEELRREREELKMLKRDFREVPSPPGNDVPPRRIPVARPPRPHHHHPPPPHEHPPRHVIDLEALAESLEDMMAGLGEQISLAVKGVTDTAARVRPPRVRIAHSRRRSKRRREVESIPPERMARVLSPLGSVDRLRILNFLKDGGKSFNEIETYIGKTGSSLTHHLTPLIDAGYVVKGAVRGTYYITVAGRLAYRLAQWLTSQVESEQTAEPGEPEVKVEFEDEEGEAADYDNDTPDSEEEW